MPFEKGHKLSPGRQKGSKNVKTEQWKSIGDYISDQGARRYLEALKAMDDKDYVERFERILEYFKPKLARTENKHEGDVNLNVTWEK